MLLHICPHCAKFHALNAALCGAARIFSQNLAVVEQQTKRAQQWTPGEEWNWVQWTLGKITISPTVSEQRYKLRQLRHSEANQVTPGYNTGRKPIPSQFVAVQSSPCHVRCPDKATGHALVVLSKALPLSTGKHWTNTSRLNSDSEFLLAESVWIGTRNTFLICFSLFHVVWCFCLKCALPSLPWPSPTSPSFSCRCPWWQPGSTSLRPASSNLDGRLNGAQAAGKRLRHRSWKK